MARCKLRNQRPKAFWGALLGGLVPSLFGFTGSIIAAKQQANALKRQQEEQNRIAKEQNQVLQDSVIAKSLNSYAESENMIDEDKYLGKYNNGGNVPSLKGKILAGGRKIPKGNHLYLLKGLEHGQTNSRGEDAISIDYGKYGISAERDETSWEPRNANFAFIFSNSPKLGKTVRGIKKSPAKLSLEAKDEKELGEIAVLQENNKKRLGIKTPPVEKRWGDYIGTPEYINLGGDILGAFGNLASNWMLSGVNIKPVLAQHTDSIYVSPNIQWRNDAKHRAIERLRQNNIRQISRNSASAQVGNKAIQDVNTNALEQHALVSDEEQKVRLDTIEKAEDRKFQNMLANLQGRNQISLANQRTQMEALQADTDIAMQRAKNIGAFVGDLGKSAVNLGNQYIQNRNDYNSLAAYLAVAGDDSVDRFLNLGLDVPANVRRMWEKYKTRPLINPYNPKGLAFPTLEASLKVPTIKRVPGLSLS